MDFTLPESGEDVRGLAHDIVGKISSPERVAELEVTRAPLDHELWRELGAAGLLGLEVPSAVAGDRGGDLTAVENMVVAEQLGRALARVPFAAHAFTAMPLIAARGSTALRETVVGPGAGGELIVTVAFEEDLGVDPASPAATADNGVLTGTKVNVPYAPAADLLLVNAIGADGPVVVVVRTDADGVTVTPTTSTGLIPTAQVDFADVGIGGDDILDGGAAAVHDVVNRFTLAICAEQSGIVSRALELTAEYAREREQFGRAIGSFQAVAQRLADGYIDAQGLSLTTTQAAWLLAGAHTDSAVTDIELRTAIATAKFWAAEAGHRVAHTTVHVHGGVGLDTSHPAHRFFLRAKQNEFTLGSASTALRRIGDALATEPA
ncbi:acyl-CoA dehydrogenase family protein [Gordonia sp. NPDC003425]